MHVILYFMFKHSPSGYFLCLPFAIHMLVSFRVIHQHQFCQAHRRRRYIMNNANVSFNSIAPQATGFISSHSKLQDLIPKNQTEKDNNLKRTTVRYAMFLVHFSGWGLLYLSLITESMCQIPLHESLHRQRPRGLLNKYGFLQGNHCCGVPF